MVASPGSASSAGKGWPFRIGTFTTSQSSQRQNWKNVVRTPRAAVIANTSRACAPHMARSLMAVGPQMECRERGGQTGGQRGVERVRGNEGQGGRETETEGNRETERARARTCIMVKPPTAMFSTMPAIWPWVRGVTLRLVPIGDDLNAVRMRLASLRNLLKGLASSTTCRAPARQGAHASSAHSMRRRKASAAAPRPTQHERVDTRRPRGAERGRPASTHAHARSLLEEGEHLGAAPGWPGTAPGPWRATTRWPCTCPPARTATVYDGARDSSQCTLRPPSAGRPGR